MGKGSAFNCRFDSGEVPDHVSLFFEEEQLKTLFEKISSMIGDTVQPLELRGREQEIIGVSQPDHRYIFYVVPFQTGYIIKFKSQDRTPFSEENADGLVQLAEEECTLIRRDPDAYHAMIPHSSRLVAGSESDAAVSMPQHDTEAFYKKHGVDPDLFDGMEIAQPPFSNRAFNCLARVGITSFSQLLRISEKELSEVPHLGRKTLAEIEEIIQSVTAPGGYTQESQSEASSVEEDDQDSKLSLQEKSRMIRTEVSDLILRAGDTEGSQDIHLESCIAFCERLEKWAAQLIADIPKLSDRARDMYIFRIVRGETLSQVGDRYEITRERVRQICIKSERRILARTRRFPDEQMLADLSRFGDILKDTSEAELYTLLNYIMEKRRLLIDLVFAIFIPKEEQPDLAKKIGNAVLPVEQRLIPTTKEKAVQKTSRIPPVPTGRFCPRCGAELLVQTARRGKNAGSRFIGCSAFPRCWYSEELSPAEAASHKVVAEP